MRLAAVVSAVAAIVTLVLGSIGEVSATALVLTVIVVGFSASWVQTGRVAQAVRRPARHRVTVVPNRHTVG